jgi:hypothetical protein
VPVDGGSLGNYSGCAALDHLATIGENWRWRPLASHDRLVKEDLAKRSGVSAPALRDFEKTEGGSDPRQGTVHKWQRALEAAGVVFVDEDELGGPGVRFKKGWPKGKR